MGRTVERDYPTKISFISFSSFFSLAFFLFYLFIYLFNYFFSLKITRASLRNNKLRPETYLSSRLAIINELSWERMCAIVSENYHPPRSREARSSLFVLLSPEIFPQVPPSFVFIVALLFVISLIVMLRTLSCLLL